MLLVGAIVKHIEEWFVIYNLIDCGFVCIIGVCVYSTSEDRKVKFNMVFVLGIYLTEKVLQKLSVLTPICNSVTQYELKRLRASC